MIVATCDRNTAKRDLVWIVAATVGAAVLCASLELSETVLAWTRPHERFQLDEIPGILLFLASALAWYAWRRVREARAEVRLRAGTEARLRDGDGAGPSQIHAGAVAIINMTDHLQVVVRDMMRRLRPAGLDELGLPAALESCVDGWRRRMPLVEFTIAVGENIGKLDEVTNITLYRLVQEGLTNVAKHARATRVEIVMQQRATTRAGAPEVVLTVQDNGVGTWAAATGAGLGIVGRRERVEALAGRFDLSSVHGGGFRFTAWLPIQPAGIA